MPQLQALFFAFASVAIIAYWRLPRSARGWWLAACNSVFLAWLDLPSFVFVAACTMATYASARRGGRGAGSSLLAIVALCLAFAYVRCSQVYSPIALPDFIAPVGFGFYMLRLIHYRVECARGFFRDHGPLSVYNYVLFFPAVVVGPIHRFEGFLRDEGRQRWDAALASEGLERVLVGYVKVIVLANWLVFNRQLFIDSENLAPALVVFSECLRYGLFLYFMFAGLSDIAIGLGLLLGYRLEENFNRPFLQPNITEFWRSWHITLSDWCRRYIFLPLMGSTRSLVISIFASMLVLGLWHEFTPRYVLWALYHASGIAVFRWYERVIAVRLPRPRTPAAEAAGRGLATALTFVFVIVGFAVTKNSTTAAMAEDFATLTGGWPW